MHVGRRRSNSSYFAVMLFGRSGRRICVYGLSPSSRKFLMIWKSMGQKKCLNSPQLLTLALYQRWMWWTIVLGLTSPTNPNCSIRRVLTFPCSKASPMTSSPKLKTHPQNSLLSVGFRPVWGEYYIKWVPLETFCQMANNVRSLKELTQ